MRKDPSTGPYQPRHPRRGGYTLVEMLVALGVGVFVVGTITTTGITLVKSMAAMGNYCDLNRESRNTLDVMSADLRNTADVSSITTNSVTVTNDLTGDVICYAWDGSNCLTRTYDGSSRIMLRGCDFLNFTGYQRNPTNNFQFLPASTPAQVKLVSVNWRCSRQILGAKLNTESMQTAQICIRN